MHDLLTDRAPQETLPGPDLNMEKFFTRVIHWIDCKLQRKLVAILAALLLITSSTFLGMVIASYKTRLVSEHARASLQVNRLLQASLENAMLKRDIEGLRDIVSRLGVQDGIAGVTILNPDLEVRFSSEPGRIGTKMDTKSIVAALANISQQTSFITADNGAQLLRSVNPVRNKLQCKECHGEASVNPVNGLLVVDYDAAGIKQNALDSALLLGGIGAIVVFASGLGIWLALQWLVVSRLRRLRHTSRQFAHGNLQARAAFNGHDEIADLAASFDTMASRLGQTMANLNASELFLQNVIDAIPDGVRVIDDNYTVIKANQAYCTQIGRTMKKVIGSKCYASSHNRSEPCPVTLVVCPVEELRQSPEKTIKVRHQHFNHEESELFVEVSAARVQLTVNGKPASYVIESIRDLAEQAKISHEQRLSEIGQLATGVAHEIHNPLSSILFALQAMQVDMADKKSKGSKLDYLHIAEAEIGKCLEVTDRLLMLSVPPGEGEELIDLDNTVREVVSLLSYQAEHENVKLNLDLEPVLRVIAADSDMRMIIINLAQNALHAMPGGGKLDIIGRHANEWIELKFTDTGEGIEQRNLNKIFLPFWTKRADASGGRGLGLSICKAIVDRAKGKMSVTSTIGKGTTFTVLLPDADFDKGQTK